MRQKPVEQDPPDHPVAAILRRGHGPRHLHDRSKLDAGRAGGFARPAVETLIDVGLEPGIVEGCESERGFLDLPHPAAGTVTLVVEDPEGGALGQAEAAVNTVSDQIDVDPGGSRGYAVSLELPVEIECGELWHQLA